MTTSPAVTLTLGANEMDIPDTTGEKFTDYESQIRAVVQSLSSEHTPMEVSGDKPVWRKIKRLKRRNPEKHAGVTAEDHLTFKKPECRASLRCHRRETRHPSVGLRITSGPAMGCQKERLSSYKSTEQAWAFLGPGTRTPCGSHIRH